MVWCNNRYWNIRYKKEKDCISCNMLMWFVLMIVCIVKCCKLFM
jgi:hypothetical protein